MPRQVVATLFIGLAVSALLIGLYQTGLFFHVAWWVQGVYEGTVLRVEPGVLLPLQYAVIPILAYGSTWIAVDTPSVGGRTFAALLATLAVVALSPTMAIYGRLFEPASGVAAILLGITAGSFYARTEQGKRRHLLRSLLGGRVSPGFIKGLSESKNSPELDSLSRPAAALTCRILNHDELSRSLDAADLARMTKRFHSLTCGLLIGRGGLLDADSPDCTRAYFGLIPTPGEIDSGDAPQKKARVPKRRTKLSKAPKNKKKNRDPEDLPTSPPAPRDEAMEDDDVPANPGATAGDDAQDNGGDSAGPKSVSPSPEKLKGAAVAACHAALELSPHLHNLSSECETETGHRIVAGIGIECGTVTSCLIDEGAGQRLGAVGTLADFTLRLSAANGSYGSDVLIGPNAFHAAKDAIEVRPLEMLYDPAATHLAEIYELVDEKGLLSEEDNARRHAFWEGVVLLRQNLPADALEKFARAKDGRRHDPPLAFFIEKATALRDEQKSGVPASVPPPRHARGTTSF